MIYLDTDLMTQSVQSILAPFILFKNKLKSILPIITKFIKTRKIFRNDESILMKGIVRDVRLERVGRIRPDGTYRQPYVLDVEKIPSLREKITRVITNFLDWINNKLAILFFYINTSLFLICLLIVYYLEQDIDKKKYCYYVYNHWLDAINLAKINVKQFLGSSEQSRFKEIEFKFPSWYAEVVEKSTTYKWDSVSNKYVVIFIPKTFLFEHLKHFKTFSKLLFFIFKLVFSVFWLYLIFCLTTDALCYINSLFNNYSSLFTTLTNFQSICASVIKYLLEVDNSTWHFDVDPIEFNFENVKLFVPTFAVLAAAGGKKGKTALTLKSIKAELDAAAGEE